jgi:hypothetical protein
MSAETAVAPKTSSTATSRALDALSVCDRKIERVTVKLVTALDAVEELKAVINRLGMERGYLASNPLLVTLQDVPASSLEVEQYVAELAPAESETETIQSLVSEVEQAPTGAELATAALARRMALAAADEAAAAAE